MQIDSRLRTEIHDTVERVLAEDVGSGDFTADLVPASAVANATIITRESMTLAGRPWVDELYRRLDASIVLDWRKDDGDSAKPGEVLCRIAGPARAVLSGERGALNLLQTLSATATVTAEYVAAVRGTACRILDTRKTIPGLRLAQKYAVRCGGGTNHRIGLFDAILIKENHIESAGGIDAAVSSARERHADAPIEVEVESLEELRQALAAGADRILLDNFSTDRLREAVAINSDYTPPSELEASGNMTLDDIPGVAATGVDYISVGALTKNIQAIDLSMRFDANERR